MWLPTVGKDAQSADLISLVVQTFVSSFRSRYLQLWWSAPLFLSLQMRYETSYTWRRIVAWSLGNFECDEEILTEYHIPNMGARISSYSFSFRIYCGTYQVDAFFSLIFCLPRSHLESKLKVFNQYYDGRSGEIRCREVCSLHLVF